VAGGDPRTRVGLAALEPRFASSIDQRIVTLARDVFLSGDLPRGGTGVESDVTRTRRAALDRSPLAEPFLQAAIEDRDPLGAEVAVRSGLLS